MGQIDVPTDVHVPVDAGPAATVTADRTSFPQYPLTIATMAGPGAAADL